MPLTDVEQREMYDKVLKSDWTLGAINDRLAAGDKKLMDCDKRLNDLEIQHSLLKGRLGAFILGLTFIVSLLVNGILWAYSHFGGKS
jgi:hypothetical protein